MCLRGIDVLNFRNVSPDSVVRQVDRDTRDAILSSDARCNTPADLVSAGSRPQGVLPCAAIRICQMTKENRLVC